MEYLNKKILNYTLTNLIGEGGMAFVYEGVHVRLGSKVAIKILNPILSANKQIRARFENEAAIMASLKHPNIVKILDDYNQDGMLAIVMELLEGKDLSETIKSSGALDVNKSVSIFLNVLDAFIYAHNKGIVHRDIKPANIYIGRDGQVKILDFGIAKLFGTGLDKTSTGTQMGTPIYMSPEQVKGERSIDHRSDIYSLGVTFYFMLKGKAPYNSDTESNYNIFIKIVNEPLPELIEYPELNEIIKKAVAKDRNHRFQDVDSFKLALEQIYNSDGELISKKNRPTEIPEIPETKSSGAPLSEPIKKTRLFVDQIVFWGIVFFLSLLIKIFTKEHNEQSSDEKITLAMNQADSIRIGDSIRAANSAHVILPDDPSLKCCYTVTIGNQIWTTKNLNVETYRNGDAIPHVQDAYAWSNLSTGAWCYYENESANGGSYGKLYNWYAVNDSRGLAPNGYHIPTDAEWTTLTDYLGGQSQAGTKMKSSFSWQKNGNGTNTSGFEGFPGGYRCNYGSFSGIGEIGIWWSLSEATTYNVWIRLMVSNFGHLERGGYDWPQGHSVRCLRD